MYQGNVGLHGDIFHTGDEERIARRTAANTRSQVQAEDLEVIADAIEVAMEARMAKSKSVLTLTWPAPRRSKITSGMISLMTSSSVNRPRSEEAPQQ